MGGDTVLYWTVESVRMLVASLTEVHSSVLAVTQPSTHQPCTFANQMGHSQAFGILLANTNLAVIFHYQSYFLIASAHTVDGSGGRDL